MPVPYINRSPKEGYFFAKIMEKIKKGYNIKITLIMISIVFLYNTAISYSAVFNSMGSLRLHIGAEDGDDTYKRIYDIGYQERISRLFDKYLIDNNLSQYSALKGLVTSELKEVLLEDPALRPVFLLVLPEENCGPLEAIDSKIIQDIGGEKILLNRSVFLVGSAEIADKMTLQGQKIIVGVTDRYSQDTMYRMHNVANNRQSYFLLSDGTWLGIKGCGQFGDETKPSHYWHEDSIEPRNERHMGIALQEEADYAVKSASELKEARGGRFVQFLGYRRIYVLPDGQENLLSTTGLKDRQGNELKPVLIFNRVIHPHRLVKLPQLLKTDPGLEHMRRRISGTLCKLGYLPHGTVLSAGQLVEMIMKELGHTEAVKQNSLLFKGTIHSQDFTFAGEEADNEELYTYETYVALIRQGLAMEDEDRNLLFNYRLGISGIGIKLRTLTEMAFYSKEQFAVLFPVPLDALKALFESYFNGLDYRYLRLWTAASVDDDLSPIRMITKNLRIDVFHPDSLGLYNQDWDLIDKVKGLILSWAQKEMDRRQRFHLDAAQSAL